MKTDKLQDALGEIRDDYVLEAHAGHAAGKKTWLRWSALAACLCIAALAVIGPMLWGDQPPAPVPMPEPPPNTGPDEPGHNTTIDPDPEPVGPQEDFTVTFNRVPDSVEIDVGIDAERKMMPCMFVEPLSEEEWAAIVPDALPAEVESAAAEYFGWPDGTLKWVYLSLVRMESGNRLHLYICPEGQQPIFDEIFMPEEITPTNIRGTMDVVLYECRDTIWTTFPWAGVEYYLTASGSPEKMDGLKEDFYNMVVSLAFSVTKPDLDRLEFHPERHVFQDKQLTMEEAQLDPDFGTFFPRTAPKGLGDGEISRLQNSDLGLDYLHGSWSVGYDYLTWAIRPAKLDNAADRIVSPEEREKYDLRLYTVPLYESVPKEYRTTVFDPVFRAEELTEDMVCARCAESDGDAPWIRFSVLFGDAVVDITAKGVTPEEIYSMLDALR